MPGTRRTSTPGWPTSAPGEVTTPPALFDGFFGRPDLLWVEPSRDVVELAASIRVRHGPRTPDALQAASCLQLGPRHLLLTGDAAFQRVHGLNVVVLA